MGNIYQIRNPLEGWKTAVLGACSQGEHAHEYPSLGHGVLTAALLGTLAGAEAGTGASFVALMPHIQETMSRLIREAGGQPQTAQWTSPPDFPNPFAAPVSGNRRALCVGVNTHQDKAFPVLQYAEQDAVAMHEALSARGYASVQVTGSAACCRPVVEELCRLAGATTADDLLGIYFGGCSGLSPEEPVLAFHDSLRVGEPGRIVCGLGLSTLHAICGDCAGKVLLILDTDYPSQFSCGTR